MALHDHAIQLGDKGMRILRFPLIKLVISFSMVMLGSAIAAVLISQFHWIAGVESYENWVKELTAMFFQPILALLAYWLFVGLFEGRPLTELNRGILKFSAWGVLLGFGFISIIMGLIALFGGYSVDGINDQHQWLSLLSMAVIAGVLEEILLRGIFFRMVEELLGTWWSVVLSALLFGFLHIWNPNATVISSLSIALTAGVVLALLYAITRNLWIVIGMHFAWNFTLGWVYSAPVSGGEAQGILQSNLDGPAWMTGGDFGPEASIITMVVFSLFGLYLIFRTIRSGQVIQPMWKMKKKNL